jgi:RNA polymerase sigma-70 factor (ECF subfamily)
VIERETALAAIAALPERDLEILALVNWHGLDPRQAAKVMGCSVPALAVRLHRARRRLARALDAAPPRSAAPVAEEAAR